MEGQELEICFGCDKCKKPVSHSRKRLVSRNPREDSM